MTAGGLLAHRLEGEGEPLLLLNGGMMSYASWEPVSRRLLAGNRLVLCDLRGQLMSPGRAPANLADNVADLVSLLDHLEIDSAHVLGTSYGGEVGLFLAALEPARVRSLVAVTVADYATEEIRRGSEELRLLAADSLAGGDRGRIHDRVVGEVYSPSFRERYRQDLVARREQIAALPDSWFEGLASIAAAMRGLDLRPHIGAIRCPTLVILAAGDEVIPAARARAVAAAIRGAETLVHPTSGHALVAEDPAWLADAARDFLARNNRPAGR